MKPDTRVADSCGFGCTIYGPSRRFSTDWGFLIPLAYT